MHRKPTSVLNTDIANRDPGIFLTRLTTAMAYSVQHILAILGSFFFHLAVFKWFAAPVLRRLWPVFATLTTDKQVSSQNCAMNLVHGAVVGGLSWYTFLSSTVDLSPDKVWKILLSMGQKTSLLYKVNGVVLLVVFFLCRILTIPLWFSLRKHLGTDELYGAGLGIHVTVFVVMPFIHSLNIYWFSKMCRAVYRGLFQPKAKQTQ
ncbi:FAM57A [Branchiostoma lanceolatum]|uniref:FAM57A protein n=1 Tax=Branchiostoma lanceolatum TaxID=7740 RepID=A0A8K0F073_BRALA|nr:FAM57A [Branchiostoma lanceolatum]